MQTMPTAAIIGCPGYTGQETLDRVLAHPELELVALGSDSLAGAAARRRSTCGSTARSRRLVPNEEALAAGADVHVPLPRTRARRRPCSAPADARRRRSLRRAPAAETRAVCRAGTASSTRGRPSSASGSTRCRSCAPADGPAVANPGCYATAALLALGAARRGDRAGQRGRRRQVGRLGRGRVAEGLVARGLRARERLGLPRRRAPARAGDRAGARLSGLARDRTCCRSGAACSSTCYVAGDRRAISASGWRRRTRPRRPSGCSPRARRRSSRASRTPTRPRSPLSRTARPGTAIVVCAHRQPRQGRRGPGGPEREPRARPRRRRSGCGSRGVLV